MKKLCIFLIILILPSIVYGNQIILDGQEDVYLTFWDEIKYIIRDDMVIQSHLSLDVYKSVLDNSNNFLKYFLFSIVPANTNFSFGFFLTKFFHALIKTSCLLSGLNLET